MERLQGIPFSNSTHLQLMWYRFVHASTDEVYGETWGVSVDEDTRMNPTNPYAASKAAAEMFIMAYRKSFGIPGMILRCNNIYGPCQYPESKASCPITLH